MEKTGSPKNAAVRRTLLVLWKSRLPVLVLPVLAGVRQIWPRGAVTGTNSNHATTALDGCWQLGLVFSTSLLTGYLRMPFTATWWLVLLLAFALETELLLGIVVVMSLTEMIGWYGARLFYPHAVSALWGCTRNEGVGADGDCGPDGCRMSRGAWKAWDLCVHAAPAACILYWHGPCIALDGTFYPGVASSVSVAAALPLNVLWLWGLGLGLPLCAESRVQLWPWGLQLADTNLAYRIAPNLPQKAWYVIYSSHWMVCGLWIALLVLPKEVIFVYSVCGIMGLTRQPYTAGWWIIFLTTMLTTSFSPLLNGMVWCTALTTGAGFYGTQMLAPYAFRALVNAWVLQPVERWAPKWFAVPFQAFANTHAFTVGARLADLCLHVLPISVAMYTFANSVTGAAALAALPTNMVYFAATGFRALSDTNLIYQVEPQLPQYVWRFIYGSHWVLCGLVWCICSAHEKIIGASAV